MHELGYATELVSTLEEYAKENNLTLISSVTLTVGEATGVIPHFMRECWPAAIEDSPVLKDSELKIDYKLVHGRCHKCENEFIVTEYGGKCPKCGCEAYDMLNGYEFEISEILAK